MNAPLFLTRQNADKPVLVPAKITQTLSDYDIDSIRHIYRFYQKNINVVLNLEDGMNEIKSLHAFITAVDIVPALIICSDSEITKWETTLENNKQINLVILKSSTDIIPDEENLVVLAPHSILRRAMALREINWHLLVIQNIDLIIDLASLKKLNSKFRIAITKYNFILYRNNQLYSKILKWIAGNNLLINEEFYFPSQWLRLSWYQYENI